MTGFDIFTDRQEHAKNRKRCYPLTLDETYRILVIGALLVVLVVVWDVTCSCCTM